MLNFGGAEPLVRQSGIFERMELHFILQVNSAMVQGQTERPKRPRRVRLQDFTCIEDPHPYGVLPGGNRFFGSFSNSAGADRKRSEEVFDEKLWQQIISFCDGCSHGRLVQASRYLYVVGHQPELWRDQVLRKCAAEKSVISKVGSSWKDTFVLMFHGNHDSNGDVMSTFIPHKPMRIPNIYSDDIYRSHLCRSFAIPTAWLEQASVATTTKEAKGIGGINEVDIVSVDDLTPTEFLKKYEDQNQPVVVRGAANGKATSLWNDWGYLLQSNNIGKKSYRTTSGAAPLPGNFSLDAYRDYIRSTNYLEESPLYLFDRTVFATNKEWENDFFPEFYKKCPYWDPTTEYGHDLLQHLGAKERPDHTWIIMGPKRSGSVFHIDPNATHAWNACIRGRKRWIFYPPGEAPPGVFPSSDGDEVALPLSVGEWIIQYWKEHTEQYRKRPVGRRPLECTTLPGDVIFVPHGWWHSVINLDESNIAITHNYVSPSNLGNALKFFNEKQDQISGCRDRKESIKPEFIHDALIKVLQAKEPNHLKRAMQQTGWTCRAWENTKAEIITDDDENNEDTATRGAFLTKKKKRKIDRVHDKSQQDDTMGKEELSSVMSKAGKVPAFSFSFL